MGSQGKQAEFQSPRVLRPTSRRLLHRGAVACRTFRRRGFVEQHGLTFDQPGQLVARRALHISVGTLQRERGSLVMVEQRGLPLGAIVTLRARRRGSFGKLLPVDIFVAVFAFGRRRLEISINELRP